LLRLPPEVQQSIKHQQISMGHARALAGIQDIALQLALLRKTREEDLSVRALEQVIRKYNLSKNKNGKGDAKIPDAFRHVAKSLAESLETEVSIKKDHAGDGGQIVIRFSDTDEFNRILDKFNA
jgi:ParB family transcriptional regulator, chromosome partitioning protein